MSVPPSSYEASMISRYNRWDNLKRDPAKGTVFQGHKVQYVGGKPSSHDVRVYLPEICSSRSVYGVETVVSRSKAIVRSILQSPQETHIPRPPTSAAHRLRPQMIEQAPCKDVKKLEFSLKRESSVELTPEEMRRKVLQDCKRKLNQIVESGVLRVLNLPHGALENPSRFAILADQEYKQVKKKEKHISRESSLAIGRVRQAIADAINEAKRSDCQIQNSPPRRWARGESPPIRR